MTQSILQKSGELNIIPKILSHNIDQQVTIEVTGEVAETTFASTGIDVEIIDHDNEENK